MGPVSGTLRVRVTKPPAGGEANQAVVRLVAAALGTAAGRVEILAGRGDGGSGCGSTAWTHQARRGGSVTSPALMAERTRGYTSTSSMGDWLSPVRAHGSHP